MSPADFVPPSLPTEEVQRLARLAEELAPLLQQARQMAPLLQQAQPMTALAEEAIRFAEIIKPHWPVIRETLRHVAELNSAAGILARQREAMATIEASFRPLPVPTPAELEEARASLQLNLPATPEQIEEVEHRAATITADPERRKLVERMTDALKQADLSKVPRATIPVLLYWLLCKEFGLPLNGHVTPSQHADFLGVITIVLMLAIYLWPRS